MNRLLTLWDLLHSAFCMILYFRIRVIFAGNGIITLKSFIYFSVFLAELEKYEKCAEQVGKCFTEWVRSFFLNFCTKYKSFRLSNILWCLLSFLYSPCLVASYIHSISEKTFWTITWVLGRALFKPTDREVWLY